MLFYIVYGIFAIGFILVAKMLPWWGSCSIKAVPALSMALLVWLSSSSSAGKILSLGLVFSAAGDVFLDLDQENYFVQGLGSFLVAHLCYSWSFSRYFKFETAKLAGVGVLTLAVGCLVYLMLPGLGNLAAPVFAYIGVIFVMATLAIFVFPTNKWLIAGALLFVLSDSLIAINKFISPFSLASLSIMVTYFSAQFLIGKSWIEMEN